ncbi:hypothetical protein CXG81DRAFT_24677 [Caulochytrium protostelioides]|uniref:GH26 domain-containing protein n=1 Tax=Caulochytrium protostelioides TaxID=1555241 RepID=A0A4P9XBF8_9FUNG|nr:hypothetical protein CXG81DRAFT_24677 [Caulochytrium protostelioides]|eukprot:RKP02712.1 hypothetical protein CXG81DRAFT_24677 [Caulochytrium protostelioides]
MTARWLLPWVAGLACLVACLTATTAAAWNLAKHEPESGLLFGMWYDRLSGVTPSDIEDKLQSHHISMWQSDINITDTLQDASPFLRDVEKINTDAAIFLTVYPFEGIDAVSDGAIADLAKLLGRLTAQKLTAASGASATRRVFLRYASEMNGNWFKYGMQPTKFVEHYRRVVTAVRAAAPEVAHIWGPNSPNGYPWIGGKYAPEPGSPDFQLLDTNHNGKLDIDDDPFTPYYPGDEYVDWVGISAYHYGKQFPWVDNVVANTTELEGLMTGTGSPMVNPYNFYRMFSGDGVGGQPKSLTSGGKPFMLTETAAAYHLNFLSDGTPPFAGPGNVAVKQSWWQQYLNPDFLARYPKFKAVCSFEFKKAEELTMRDFSLTLDPAVAAAFVQDAEKMKTIHWAQPVTREASVLPDVLVASKSSAPRHSGTAERGWVAAVALTLAPMLLSAVC